MINNAYSSKGDDARSDIDLEKLKSFLFRAMNDGSVENPLEENNGIKLLKVTIDSMCNFVMIMICCLQRKIST